MMGMAQQLLLDRKVGDYTLPPGWIIVAAGNRKEDKAAVSAMPSPVANRMIHLDIIPSASDWSAYVTKTGSVSPTIVGYIMSMFKGGAGKGSSRNWEPLLAVPTDGRQRFPSPRSWEVASRLLEVNLPVALAVGEAQAAAFKVFHQRHSKLVESLASHKPVTINGGDALVVAWMAEAAKSTSKITVDGGARGEFAEMRKKIKELLED